jgi:hypothetical protein
MWKNISFCMFLCTGLAGQLYSATVPGNPVEVTLSPSLEGYYPGTLVSDNAGNCYIHGIVNGTTGLLKIDALGRVELLTTNVQASNNATVDAAGEYLYILYYDMAQACNAVQKVSLGSGELISDVYLNPSFDWILAASLSYGYDGYLYALGKRVGEDDSGIVQINASGGTSFYLEHATSNFMSADCLGEYLYILNRQPEQDTLNKISLAQKSVESEAALNPQPEYYYFGGDAFGGDGCFYVICGLNGEDVLAQITQKGEVSKYVNAPDCISTSPDGVYLYLLYIHNVDGDTTSAQGAITGTGVRAASTVDLSNRQLSLSKYTLVEKTDGDAIGDGQDEIVIGPNPCNLKKGDRLVNFYGASKYSEIKIYNIAGDFVAKIQIGETGTAIWQIHDDNKGTIAAGVYLCLFSNSQGEKHIKKLAIIK